MGKKGDLSDFERGMVVGARRAGLCISATAEIQEAVLRLLGDSLLEDLVVALQQGVMLALQLLQLGRAALQALLALR